MSIPVIDPFGVAGDRTMPTLQLAVDPSVAQRQLEQRLSRLCGWVLEAERSGANYGLRLPGTEIAPGRGELHRAACLQALALYQSA